MKEHKIITLGEVLMRLSPIRNKRFGQSNEYESFFGGAELNVAASLGNFGLNVSMATVLPSHEIGKEALNYLKRYDVNTTHVIRNNDRLGIYFTEAASMQRGGKVIYDRAFSGFSQLAIDTFDWDDIFQDATWFHWSGITPAVSKNAALLTKVAIEKAYEKGLSISMDYNYRSKLWQWGKSHEEVMPELMEKCHVMSGIHPDVDLLKEEVSDLDFALSGQDMMNKYPHCKVVVFSSRGVISANHHTWQGVLYDGKKVYRSKQYQLTHIVDRIGGGDAFMAGVIYGLHEYEGNLQSCIDFATAASALKHGIDGDFNAITKEEVVQMITSDNGSKVER
ncbi:sugar kinase [Flammeovirga sp. SubArs3]|uniref:sugar kinase n=1 Tax=Flammeovirga sp. SubArs3 TaxID=2995316 RepID=UPI00248C938D|nr:sugar kinase [Flammeovirga sp. SubArs3]